MVFGLAVRVKVLVASRVALYRGQSRWSSRRNFLQGVSLQVVRMKYLSPPSRTSQTTPRTHSRPPTTPLPTPSLRTARQNKEEDAQEQSKRPLQLERTRKQGR